MNKYSWMVLSFVLMLLFWAMLFNSWVLATTFLVLFAVHEFGHYSVARRLGLDVSPPIFTPIGAMIKIYKLPENAVTEAMMAYAGPLAGTVGTIIALAFGNAIGSDAVIKGAEYSLFFNLFNLIPLSPLDGGRISMAITRHLWVLGALLMGGFMLLYVVYGHGGIITLLVFAIIVNFAIEDVQMRSQQARVDPSYFAIGAPARIAFGLAYVGLIGALMLMMYLV